MNFYLAVAPCTFLLGGKHYKLSAGDTISLSDELATQVASPSFRYGKHLKLISKSVEAQIKEELKVEEVKVEPKVEEKAPAKKSAGKPEVKVEEVK